MKTLIFLLALVLVSPAFAAGAASADQAPAKAEKDKPVLKEETNKTGEKDGKTGDAKAEKEESAEPGEYSCKFYKVKLPDGWKAILPPSEQQGVVNAIFARNSGSPAISILIGKNGGADAKTIAGMFAEQFKSPKPPAENKGQYTFQYPQHDGITANVTVSCADDYFMVITVTGSMKEARQFIRDNIKSDEYKELFPQ